MFHQQLVDYIREQVRQGRGKEEIKKVLLEQKWEEADIEESFRHATMSSLNMPPSPPSSSSLSATKNFGQAWKLFESRLGVVIGITLLSIAIGIVLIGIGVGILLAAGLTIGSITSIALLSEIIFGSTSLLVTLIIVAFVIGLALSVLSVWSQLAAMFAFKDADQRIGVIESYRRSWRVLLSYWWIMILTGIIMTSGFLLFIIPGILFAVWFSFAGFILICEKEKGLRALFKSKEYVRGYWWNILWNFIFIGLVYLLVYIGLWAISLLPLPEIIFAIIDFILQLFYPMLAAACTYILYKNLRTIKGEVTVAVTGRKKAWFSVIALFPWFFFLLFIPFLMKMTQSIIKSGFNSNAMYNDTSFQFEEDDNSTLFGSAIREANDQQRISDIRQIQTALELYYLDHNEYPVGSSISLGDAPLYQCLNDSGFSTYGCANAYLQSIPKAPGVDEFYLYSGEGQTYTIITDLEVGTDEFDPGTIAATPEGIQNF